MGPGPGPIDLRRFARAGEVVTLSNARGAPVRLRLEHVSTRWLSASIQPGDVQAEDVIRGELARDGCRLAVVLEAFSVEPRTAHAALVELSVVDAVVLGERRRPRLDARAHEAWLLVPRRDRPTQRLPARIVDVSQTGVAFQAEDRLAPGDEVTLAGDEGPFEVRVRVIRRSAGSFGRAVFGCQVLVATPADEDWMRRLLEHAA
jgi:PilZ domain